MWIIGMALLKARLRREVILMGLAFIEQVEMLCSIHSLQVSESGKDICNSILAAVVKNARQELTEDSIRAAAANDDQETLHQPTA